MTAMYTSNNGSNMYGAVQQRLQHPSPTLAPSQPNSQPYGNAFNSNNTAASTYGQQSPGADINTQPYNIVALSTQSSNRPSINADTLIINVWADNLHTEIARIADVVDQYNYIAMDTEFPGVVARPVGSFKNSADYHYQTLKCNVDLLKIIQLGLCFCDCNGNIVPGLSTWQFNFRFSLSEDMYAQDSIDLLRASGINFMEHAERGIDVFEFGELLITSGIVLNDDVKWVSFHSGYDFGYLLKLITAHTMPATETEFFEWLLIYFPCIYDMKFMMKSCENLNGGLQKLAEMLNIERIGPQHQAGSDALLTAATFYKLRQAFFDGVVDDGKFMNVLYGLGVDTVQMSGTADSKSMAMRRKNNTGSVAATPIKSLSSNDDAGASQNGFGQPTAAPPPGFS